LGQRTNSINRVVQRVRWGVVCVSISAWPIAWGHKNYVGWESLP